MITGVHVEVIQVVKKNIIIIINYRPKFSWIICDSSFCFVFFFPVCVMVVCICTVRDNTVAWIQTVSRQRRTRGAAGSRAGAAQTAERQ